MSFNWAMWDRIRVASKTHRLYQSDRTIQDQSSLATISRDLGVGGMKRSQLSADSLFAVQTNRFARYRDYEMMDHGELALALDIHAQEACLAGSSRIPLLDGTNPTIKELAEKGIDHQFWVYAFDQKTNEYVPALASGARVTRRNAQTIKVTFDDGESLTVTPDHQFMLRDGTFREAGQLQAGDSLKPLYKQHWYRRTGSSKLFDKPKWKSDSVYEYLFTGKHFESTHRWVYRHFHDDKPEIVHHADFDSVNNTPDNLQGMTRVEHDAIHRKSGKDHPSFNHITLADIESKLSEWHGPMLRDALCELCDIGEKVLYRILKENDLKWSEFRDRYHHCSKCNDKMNGPNRICKSCKSKYMAEWHQSKKNDVTYHARRVLSKRKSYKATETRVCRYCELPKAATEFQKNNCAYSPYCNECRPVACQKHYLKKSFANHKVLSVEISDTHDEVYDIEVPGYNCFAAGTQTSWVIVHNCIIDPERKKSLVVKARNSLVKNELEDLFFNTLDWESIAYPTARYLCKYGDNPFEIIPTVERDGVAAIKHIEVREFTRMETRNGDLIGFFYNPEQASNQPTFMHPWRVSHMRLTSLEKEFKPYGMSVLDRSRTDAKRVRLVAEAAIIYRLTRATERRKFKIPVGNIAPKEIPEFLNMIARTYKRKRVFDPRTGQFDEKYSPLIQEDDYFLPQRGDGQGIDVENLPGGANLDKIDDLEYFKKQMIAPTNIPPAMLGVGEGAGQPTKEPLYSISYHFARSIERIQRSISSGLMKIAIVHLLLKGFSIEDIKSVELHLPIGSAIEELYRMEAWQTRVSVMTDLKALEWFPKEWIVTHFTDLTPDEIVELNDMIEQMGASPESLQGGGGGGGGAPPPSALGDVEDLDQLGADLENAPEESAPPEGGSDSPPNDIAALAESIRGMSIRDKRRTFLNVLKEWYKKKREGAIAMNGYGKTVNDGELRLMMDDNSVAANGILTESAIKSLSGGEKYTSAEVELIRRHLTIIIENSDLPMPTELLAESASSNAWMDKIQGDTIIT